MITYLFICTVYKILYRYKNNESILIIKSIFKFFKFWKKYILSLFHSVGDYSSITLRITICLSHCNFYPLVCMNYDPKQHLNIQNNRFRFIVLSLCSVRFWRKMTQFCLFFNSRMLYYKVYNKVQNNSIQIPTEWIR